MHNIQTEYDHKIKGYGRNTTYCSWLSGVQSGLTKLKDVYLYTCVTMMPNYEQCSALRRLSGQHVDHQIFLKFLDMLSLDINYYLTKKKSM